MAKKIIGAMLISANLSIFALQTLAVETFKEKEIFIAKENNESEVTFEIHHPGLVRWIEAGQTKSSYTIPGCFYASNNDVSKHLNDEFLAAIVIENIGYYALSRENYLGTTLFVDRSVRSLYVGHYRISTKSGESFALMHDRIMKNHGNGTLGIAFSRGCAALATPPFATVAGAM